MRQPTLRPLAIISEERCTAQAQRSPASPPPKRAIRPGWKATIVRQASFDRLRAIQKSTTDPAIDLSYLTEACLQLALELGAEAIVKRALASLRAPARTEPTSTPSMEHTQ